MTKKILSLLSNLVPTLPIKNFLYMLVVIFFFSTLTSLFGCSGADPVIYQLETRLQAYWKYPFESQERLLVQIFADDDDGFDEIYEVYIINDEEELYWRATRDEWDLVTVEDGKQWIVLTHIYSERHDKIPRGEYRLVLMDFSGFRAERRFTIDNLITNYNRNFFPVLSIQEGKTYMPVLNIHPNNTNAKLYLELAYPNPEVDVAGNQKTDEFRKAISFLGKDGEFFEIAKNIPIKFVLNNTSKVNVFLHYLSEENMLFTSGPFEIDFDKVVN